MVLPVSGSQSFQACHRIVCSVIFCYPIYQVTSDMFELVENSLHSCADDSALLAVVRKPADRPAVAASLNRDITRIQEWVSRLVHDTEAQQN